METKTKIVPFEIELARKIQAGEVPGKIKTRGGEDAQVICWDRFHIFPIVYLRGNERNIETTHENGMWSPCHIPNSFDLVLEVPDDEIKDHPVYHHKLQPFDRVLVRNYNNTKWRASLYSHKDGVCYYCAGVAWNQCIPYEGNEHLLGTTDAPEKGVIYE